MSVHLIPLLGARDVASAAAGDRGGEVCAGVVVGKILAEGAGIQFGVLLERRASGRVVNALGIERNFLA